MAKKIKRNDSEEKSLFHIRLSTIAAALGVSNRQFGVKIGKSLGYIGSVGDDINLSVAINILDAFPTVNPHYLLYGEGDILISTVSSFSEKEQKNSPLNIYLEKKVNQQEREIRELHQEIGRLKAIIEGKKHCAQQTDNAVAVVAG